ncbi:hypothetical protein AS034_11840 [[Bacillus] enclensis]|uniref:Uncharacterized protein n=1 Tax=[Bacillus] enclensis TaxID=1402860 RepID=A0A0V8HJG5_9BACI|nr:hypothetical protein [[Bacillus] enclensis]KSU62787.1 hypothetical protein AS034_11840 [[Bacillus] enclensis]QTC42679.1 hypothetical protein I7V34_05360 [Bacillus sp. V3]SCC09566.1 hypothetical protein GA0061094_2454 [[Bacillus] enclensis]
MKLYHKKEHERIAVKNAAVPKTILAVILTAVISSFLVNLLEKRDVLTAESNLETHLKDLIRENQKEVSVVLRKKIRDQYFLVYSIKGDEPKLGLAQYKEADLLPLYELVSVEEGEDGLLGSSYLNTSQFLVYGNRKETGAAYFQYRDNIEFKKVETGNDPYFLQVESYGGQLALPLVIFYNNEGEEVASVPAE